ncbi:type II toxin-antitoxin system HipA family toxin [Pleionea sediminis]|uniref:type II toxin-antitoxin system HipA family toxin n=1 Tax=Pleionea sediminis TaxID=2569479 RepID=UPI001184AB9C|nr:type II toxin-antitoxin system HipA family toxin [Pleionea sediminis]
MFGANRVEVADVLLFGKEIAAVSWDEQRGVANFEYLADFLQQGLEPSPLKMPVSQRIYNFPNLEKHTYYGLPGLLADCLPDKFGNALINAWLVRQGRTGASFSPIERLCYVGSRGMGALEFRPTLKRAEKKSRKLEIGALVELASDILLQRQNLSANIKSNHDKEKAFEDIIRVGTSAGGARAKAVIAWSRNSNEIRSGQVTAPEGFSYWILKFDGVDNNRDKELSDPKGFGRVEFAYYLMAKEAGITMMPCELIEENGRAHFVTKRFDRFDNGDKLHVQSLCAMDHLDFNMAGAHSYEQAFDVMMQLNLTKSEVVEQFRRMVFNVLARNQDDHTKNIAYVMNATGQWRLSPAFDVCFSYNPKGEWTHQHQMSINGKRDHFNNDDFMRVAEGALITKNTAKQVIADVELAVKRWLEFARESNVNDDFAKYIQQCLRVER